MAPALVGGNRMVWTEMRLTIKGLETGIDCGKYTVLYRKRGLGVREDHLEVRLTGPQWHLNRVREVPSRLGTSETREESGMRVMSGLSIADPTLM